ncbi:Non-symbiotic hemoglobin [Frankliniella fusca]|uniref:Non-symbiotic hemoglobin n=1 Tax=Frankliniella fusca TaxID=407009 RepID=A0AAE1HAB6_9NEOP|nr:Non-symbiotic hemoglobin [Frankliniella fusca]
MSGVDSMISSVLDLLQNKFIIKGQNEVFSVSEIVSTIEQLRGQSAFEGVQTPEKLKKNMDCEQGLVEPVKVVLKQREVIKDNIVKTIDVDFAYVVPFLPSLEKILNCPEVLYCIKNPLPVKPGVFSSSLDSYFYQSHPIVKDDPHTLGIGLYADGVDLTDSASSKSGVHPVTFIYFVLFNIHPKLRSSVRAIFLLACVKSSFLKNHGYAKILDDFIKILNKLSSKEGIRIRIGNEEVVFHGIFICFCGDNPASENVGGFKESHFAAKPCRQCFVSKED